MIKGVIFDMDGVMIDSERQSNLGWAYAAEKLNTVIPDWLIDSFKGAPRNLSKKFFDDYFHGEYDYWEARQLRTEYILKLRKREGIPVKKGLFELLKYLKDNDIKCAVATSTRRDSAENTLKTIKAWDYLDTVVYGDSVDKGKPQPDIFILTAKELQVKPSKCIVIEDSINGIKAGYAAGARVVHVPDTIKIDEDIKKLTYRICDDLTQVIDVIKELNNRVD